MEKYTYNLKGFIEDNFVNDDIMEFFEYACKEKGVRNPVHLVADDFDELYADINPLDIIAMCRAEGGFFSDFRVQDKYFYVDNNEKPYSGNFNDMNFAIHIIDQVAKSQIIKRYVRLNSIVESIISDYFYYENDNIIEKAKNALSQVDWYALQDWEEKIEEIRKLVGSNES